MSLTLHFKKSPLNTSSYNLIPSDHSCYILLAKNHNKFYIGYTTNLKRRLRQHNGELVGGAKKTKRWGPWVIFCHFTGFVDKSTALRFEFRLQHPKRRKFKTENIISYILYMIYDLLNKKDGVFNWPTLTILWYDKYYHINRPNIINNYLI